MLARPCGHRQHRHAGLGVIGLHEQRQRPEVRRRPQEDDGEQQPRQQRRVARHRRPADDDRKGAGRAADDDVLRRPALQPDGIDDDVEQDRDGEPEGRHPVDREAHDGDRAAASMTPKRQRLAGSILPAGSGRLAVRFITASISASYHWLSAPEAPAATAMHRMAVKAISGCMLPGAASMAQSAVKIDQRHHPRLQQREIIAPFRKRRGRRGDGGVADWFISKIRPSRRSGRGKVTWRAGGSRPASRRLT